MRRGRLTEQRGERILTCIVEMFLPRERHHLVHGESGADGLDLLGRDVPTEAHTVDLGADMLPQLGDSDACVLVELFGGGRAVGAGIDLSQCHCDHLSFVATHSPWTRGEHA